MNNRGFTLVEVLVVVIIAGVLSVIGLVAYGNYVHETRATEALEMFAGIERAQKFYLMQRGTYFNATQPADFKRAGVDISDASQFTYQASISGPDVVIKATSREGWVSLTLTPTGRIYQCDGSYITTNMLPGQGA